MKPSVARSPLDAVAPAMAQAGTDSPMTAHLQDLWRQASRGEQGAWMTLHDELRPLMERWVSRQAHVDSAAVLDHAWATFVQTAPQRFRSVREAQLRMVLTFLRTCVKRALLRQLRIDRDWHAAPGEAPTPARPPDVVLDLWLLELA